LIKYHKNILIIFIYIWRYFLNVIKKLITKEKILLKIMCCKDVKDKLPFLHSRDLTQALFASFVSLINES